MPELLARNPVLKEMLIDRRVINREGETRPVLSAIRPRYAEALYRFVLQARPRLTVEVGLANGASTLSILTALADIGGDGKLVSIDPFQREDYAEQGLINVERAGLAARHAWIGEADYLSLPRLLGEGTKVDFGYIDGWHTFDYTLLDFWYLDKMLPVGGHVAFNDCGWRAVQKAIGFLLTHRKYVEVDVGLAPSVVLGRELIRWTTGRWGRQYKRMNQDRYFRKVEAWEPPHDFFRSF
jgi:predicted O-methyltransferase YrrM